MLYTEYFTMRHYVGFLQIGSHTIMRKMTQKCTDLYHNHKDLHELH